VRRPILDSVRLETRFVVVVVAPRDGSHQFSSVHTCLIPVLLIALIRLGNIVPDSLVTF
jgi:hypothetical protein